MQSEGLGVVILTAIIFSLIGMIYTGKKKYTLEEYITSRNKLSLFSTIATLLASMLGAWILFSPAEAAVNSGIWAVVGYALGHGLVFFILAWIGKHIRNLMPNGHSITEFVYHRYGTIMYAVVLVISLFYMSVFLAAELTGIALAANIVFEVPLYLTALVVGIGTLAYTATGGFKASVFTDKIQAWLIIPLLLIVFFSVVSTVDVSIDSLEITSKAGIDFGLTLIIAIIGANLFHQGYWQRVYAAEEKKLKGGFIIAGLLVIPMILLVSWFGLAAESQGIVENPSVALFSFLLSLPDWLILSTMVLAVTLIMSSMDTLLNGIVSIISTDAARLQPGVKHQKILKVSRWATIAIALLAILIASQGYSVLYLFLVADLVCVAAVFPTFFGFFSKKISGNVAALAILLGIGAGIFFFPLPDFSSSIVPLAPPNLLHSFAAAAILPALFSKAFAHLGEDFDLKKLRKRAREL